MGRKPYSGDLGKKRLHKDFGFISATDEELNAHWAAEDAETRRRLALLYQHYGVPVTRPDILVQKLAEAHVPGFQHEKAKRGQRSPWNPLVRAILAVDVDSIRDRNPHLSVFDACKKLGAKPPWKAMVKTRISSNSLNNGDALRKQYEKADRVWVKRLKESPDLEKFREALGLCQRRLKSEPPCSGIGD